MRENRGKEGGESGFDRERIEVEGEIGERREEVVVVVRSGGRRCRETRDGKVEERGMRWWKCEVVVVKKACAHFWWEEKKREEDE